MSAPKRTTAAPQKGTKVVKPVQQVWMEQEDVFVDEPLAYPRLQMKDYALLAFCAWNSVVISAVLGNYVADIMIYSWFMTVLWLVNMALWRALGSEFLWSIFLKRDVRASMKSIVVAIVLYFVVALVAWGVWMCMLTWMDFGKLGQSSLPMPVLTRNWQDILYWTGLPFSMIIEGVVASIWWNVLYDNAAKNSWALRAWALLCIFGQMWCFHTPMCQGTWWWLWLLLAANTHMMIAGLGFFLYDKFSLGAPMMARLGLYTGLYLVLAGSRWQWWTWVAFSEQYGWAPGNLWNINDTM